MARIQRDNFHGGWNVTGLEHDLRKAEKNARFRNDMNQTGVRAVHEFQSIPQSAATTSAVVLGSGIGVGVGMVKSRRFRYIMQAIFHLPMAWILLWPVALYFTVIQFADQQLDDQTVGQGAALALLIAFVGAIIWTTAYIVFRTRPKLRALRNY